MLAPLEELTQVFADGEAPKGHVFAPGFLDDCAVPVPVDLDLVFNLLIPMEEEADAGMSDDDEDHEPSSDATGVCDDHPCEHPSRSVLDDPAPSETPPIAAPAVPPLAVVVRCCYVLFLFLLCIVTMASWQHCIDHNTASARLSVLWLAAPAAQVSGETFFPPRRTHWKNIEKHSNLLTSPSNTLHVSHHDPLHTVAPHQQQFKDNTKAHNLVLPSQT